MENNIQSFIKLWKEFEEVTEINYKKFFKNEIDEGDIYTMLNKLATIKSTIYNKAGAFIDYCRRKRNLISHGNYEEEYNIYMEDFIVAFKDILGKAKPVSVYEKSTHPVITHNINDTISNVLKDMNKNNYTHIPITENGKLVGIISESSILKYLAENDETIIEQNHTFNEEEYKELIDLKYSKDNVLFVAKNDDYDIIVNKFIEEFKKGEKLSCVLITENGNSHEGILGILTTRDIIGRDD